MTGEDQLALTYSQRYSAVLQPLAHRLEEHIGAILRDSSHGLRRVDRVVVRAKTPSSFLHKAAAIQNGAPKYSDPFNQIMDQLGARIVAFYLSDVEPLAKLIKDYIPPVEEEDVIPESPKEFGYEAKHFILLLPKDILTPEITRADCPTFFELQIATLFQHAWAEADHDLCYKARQSLSREQNKKLAFTAAQAWGADRIFDELFAELTSSEAA